jgi:hypothetical protein
VLLHERYQDPSQRSKISFPASSVVEQEPVVAVPVAEEPARELVDLSILEDDGAATDEVGEHAEADEAMIEVDDGPAVDEETTDEPEELEEAI